MNISELGILQDPTQPKLDAKGDDREKQTGESGAKSWTRQANPDA